MYLKSLEIERFRAFRHTDVSFRYPGAAASGEPKYPNINLLLGNKGWASQPRSRRPRSRS